MNYKSVGITFLSLLVALIGLYHLEAAFGHIILPVLNRLDDLTIDCTFGISESLHYIVKFTLSFMPVAIVCFTLTYILYKFTPMAAWQLYTSISVVLLAKILFDNLPGVTGNIMIDGLHLVIVYIAVTLPIRGLLRAKLIALSYCLIALVFHQLAFVYS